MVRRWTPHRPCVSSHIDHVEGSSDDRLGEDVGVVTRIVVANHEAPLSAIETVLESTTAVSLFDVKES